jgi:hypothetical protein
VKQAARCEEHPDRREEQRGERSTAKRHAAKTIEILPARYVLLVQFTFRSSSGWSVDATGHQEIPEAPLSAKPDLNPTKHNV